MHSLTWASANTHTLAVGSSEKSSFPSVRMVPYRKARSSLTGWWSFTWHDNLSQSAISLGVTCVFVQMYPGTVLYLSFHCICYSGSCIHQISGSGFTHIQSKYFSTHKGVERSSIAYVYCDFTISWNSDFDIYKRGYNDILCPSEMFAKM